MSGGAGAKLTWSWAESLYLPKSNAKGQRDEFIGKSFHGMTDTFLPGGGAHQKFHHALVARGPLVSVVHQEAAEEPLTLHRLALDESRYPYELQSSFDDGDSQLPDVLALTTRGIQMCAHETYMDCPFYEQLMYDGDTRLELLTTYAMTGDDRLAKRAIELFDFSRRNWGFVNERYPAYLAQNSPTFSLIWALMLNDYAFWRNNPEFVRAHAIGLHSMLEHFEPYVNHDGLLESLPGWSFMLGAPVAGRHCAGWRPRRFCAEQFALRLCPAKIRRRGKVLGEPLLAQRLLEKANHTAAAVRAKFWDESRGLMADNLAHTEFSEHGQCLALLTDTLTGDQAQRCFEQLLTAPDLKRTTIYFSFYLMETWQKFGRGDLILKRLDFWKDLVKQGLKTPVEMPGDTRSDCHAWGQPPAVPSTRQHRGHPSGLAGLPHRPHRAGAGRPAENCLSHPASRRLHCAGSHVSEGHCRGTVELPAGITGVFAWHGREQKLNGGMNSINLAP